VDLEIQSAGRCVDLEIQSVGRCVDLEIQIHLSLTLTLDGVVGQ
jgi:hypothetical protein